MPISPEFISPSRKGFTLIELMVAISIIAILATVGLIVYSTAQKAGRISKRVQDLKAVQAAIETFKVGTGHYPVVTMGTDTNWRSQCTSWGGQANNLVIPEGFVPTYMPVLPADPQMVITGVNGNCYLYRSDGYEYKFMAHQIGNILGLPGEMTQTELKSQPNLIDPYRDGSATGGSTCDDAGDGTAIYTWAVYSSGARCW